VSSGDDDEAEVGRRPGGYEDSLRKGKSRPVEDSDEERDARMRAGGGYENVPRSAGDADAIENVPQVKKPDLTEAEKARKAKEDEEEVERLKAERDRLGRLLDGTSSVDKYNEEKRRDRGPPGGPPSSQPQSSGSSGRDSPRDPSRDSPEYRDDDSRDRSRSRGSESRYGAGMRDQREEDLRYSRPEGRDRSAIGKGGGSSKRYSEDDEDPEEQKEDQKSTKGEAYPAPPVIQERKLNDFISVPVITSLF